MASNVSSYLEPSYPKDAKNHNDDDLYHDDNDYSDERTIPKVSLGLARRTCLGPRSLWNFWRDLVNIITDATIIGVILWIYWNVMKTGSIDLLVLNPRAPLHNLTLELQSRR